MKNIIQNIKIKLQRNRLFLFQLTIPIFIFSLFCNYIVIENTSNQYNKTTTIPYNDFGLVLGTSKYLKSGKINPYFQNRISATIELFKAEKIKFILISGDNSRNDYNEPLDFKTELIKLGIPEDKIFLDYAGFRTLDSVVRAKEIFGLQSFTIISQDFHNTRALFIANYNNINAVSFNANNTKFKVLNFTREYLARTKVILDIILKIQPKFLGDKIDLQLT